MRGEKGRDELVIFHCRFWGGGMDLWIPTGAFRGGGTMIYGGLGWDIDIY